MHIHVIASQILLVYKCPLPRVPCSCAFIIFQYFAGFSVHAHACLKHGSICGKTNLRILQAKRFSSAHGSIKYCRASTSADVLPDRKKPPPAQYSMKDRKEGRSCPVGAGRMLAMCKVCVQPARKALWGRGLLVTKVRFCTLLRAFPGQPSVGSAAHLRRPCCPFHKFWPMVSFSTHPGTLLKCP